MSAIQNVTLVGGSGRLGAFVLKKLVVSKKFNVQILKRVNSSSTFTAGTKVVEADFEDIESLKAVFQDQDAVVSIISDAGVLSQKPMVDAAITAGVKRFIPSDFGSNMANPKSRQLPVFARKIVIEDYLIEKSKSTELTYSFVYVGGLTDFTIRNNVVMDFSKYAPTIYNGGETQFSTTSMPAVGDAVVGVLSHPEETRNRAVYVSEIIFSQNQLLSLAKQISPRKPWAPVDVKLDVVVNEAMERLAQGIHDLPTIIPILLKSVMDPEYGVKFTTNDNELLGIKIRTEEYLVELITPLII
ncbi:NAD(P)-binding protein [Polychaeton citri CBS 116435]|uniref:NAD(P)-binding protein n=1 Tax=Polychaeton citri CBS 116435 TaxID=1314669 RepID=A0A9P4UQ11_9PEZI|nr:NAD(P)-binding protein [Polychaeton citri CBS 116435]